MSKIRVAIIGVGNCASSLVQGLAYYRGRDEECSGVMHARIGGAAVSDVECVLAIDTDARKVGQDLADAIFAAPNCTKVFCPDVTKTGVTVMMGRVLDGMAAHMLTAPPERGFVVADQPEADKAQIVAALKESGAEILVNYLPVGS